MGFGWGGCLDSLLVMIELVVFGFCGNFALVVFWLVALCGCLFGGLGWDLGWFAWLFALLVDCYAM